VTRLFVSLELPELVKQSVALLCSDVPGARWVEPEQIHLTLRFIGDVDGLGFQDVEDALASVRSEPFDLTLKGVGHFPPRGEPHVLWVGVEKSEPLVILHDRVESALVRVGLERERRKFAPHVSIARLRATPSRAVASFLARNALFRTEPIPVDEFHLVSSQLTPKHAVHRNEATYPLGDGVRSLGLAR
jgi:RNA 2',3'-cyclic 3'-phosphodiesterase